MSSINTIIRGDVRKKLRELQEDSVDCVITSPPYFRLRNYGNKNQIGLETHVDQWVKELCDLFSDLAKVLKDSGSVWLNLGDSYSRNTNAGAPAKSLLLAPERLLLALSKSGWIVRNKIVWAKTNPMPSSVRDRLAAKHEYIYFLTRSPKYFFDLDAIRSPHKTGPLTRPRAHATYPPVSATPPSWAGPLAGNNSGLTAMKRNGRKGHVLGKNPGDVWPMATASFRGAHFATFPKQLIERPLLASCPEKVCSECGAPWIREPAKTLGHLAVTGELAASCECHSETRPGVVLDPFFGAGTVALVAEELGRSWIGIELSSKYAALATRRIQDARDKQTNSKSA